MTRPRGEAVAKAAGPLVFVVLAWTACHRAPDPDAIPDAPVSGTIAGAPYVLDVVHFLPVDTSPGRQWTIEFRGKASPPGRHNGITIWLEPGVVPAAGATLAGSVHPAILGPVQIEVPSDKGETETNASSGRYRVEITKWSVVPYDPSLPRDKDLPAPMRRVGKATGKVLVVADEHGKESRLSGSFTDADVIEDAPDH